jgi:hypothetical protein
VAVNALDPGALDTDLGRATSGGLVKIFGGRTTPAEAAEAVIRVASSPAADGESGRYYVRGRASEPSDAAGDSALAARLWAASEQLTALPSTRARAGRNAERREPG